MPQRVNSRQLSQTTDEDTNLKRWRETTKILLDAEHNLYCQPYSICSIPEELLKRNENAYEPKEVSIGPRFKGKRELQPMEETKWRCIQSLISRTKCDDGAEILDTCMREMMELDATVRACYGEEIKPNRYELAKIMVYDGCFLLELVIINEEEWGAPKHSAASSASVVLGTKVMEAILSDLTLVENQIPFFILEKLFQLLFPGNHLSNSIEFMVSLLWQQQLPKRIYPAHIVELVHSTFLSMHDMPIGDPSSPVVVDVDEIGKQVQLNRCASKLIAAGVIIRLHPGSDTPVFRIHDFSVQFSYSNGVLLIPLLRFTQTTESKWRSFIAWEHHKSRSKQRSSDGNEEFGNSTEQDGIAYANVFAFLALLFNDLICGESDVQLLKNMGIIKDVLSMSNHELVDLFRSIANGVDRGRVDSSYRNMVDALNTYSVTNFVSQFTINACHYLGGIHKFLRRGYNFAAALITLLTVVQTCYAVLSYHYPRC